jgi:hypothetical protein
MQVMDQEQKLELGCQIWHLCRAGYNRIQILEELAISVQQLEDAFREFESQVAIDAGRAIEHYRQLDCERLEEVIQCWMSVALGAPSRADEDDFDLRLKASYGILAGSTHGKKLCWLLNPRQPRFGREIPRRWCGYSASIMPIHPSSAKPKWRAQRFRARRRSTRSMQS